MDEYEMHQYFKVLKPLIKEAGQIILNLHDYSPMSVEKKADGTLVSDADKASSDYIVTRLSKAYQNYAILDEEKKEDGSRATQEFCWFVDPLDNTKGFLERDSNYGVIIGLTQFFNPILGIVYKPVSRELYWAAEENGAFLEQDGYTKEDENDGAYSKKKSYKRELKVLHSTRVNLLVSDTRMKPETEELIDKIKPDYVGYKGGSLKITDVAANIATLFLCPRSSGMRLWDFCGPQVILEEAGGMLTDLEGRPFDYSGDHLNTKGAIASNGVIHESIVKKIK